MIMMNQITFLQIVTSFFYIFDSSVIALIHLFSFFDITLIYLFSIMDITLIGKIYGVIKHD